MLLVSNSKILISDPKMTFSILRDEQGKKSLKEVEEPGKSNVFFLEKYPFALSVCWITFVITELYVVKRSP